MGLTPKRSSGSGDGTVMVTKPQSCRKKSKVIVSPDCSPPNNMAIPLPPTAYRMHVSQRYLELTRQKLDLIRLPRDAESARYVWDVGVSKTLLEGLIDHWLEGYNWREQESFYNDALPQFRVTVDRTRLHFVHKRSDAPNAIPLLFVTAWPESFLSVTHVIDALSNPVSARPYGNDHVPAFHVVAPSIPGFAFSDTVPEEANNMSATADMFDKLMKRLGYNEYMVHGTGWAFKICRVLALRYSSCIAVHTTNPDVPSPQSHGYGHSPVGTPVRATPPSTPGGYTPPLARPQTVSYGLTDSPAGLLAYMLDAIQPPLPGPASSSPLMVRPPTTPAADRSSPQSMTTASTPAAASSAGTAPSPGSPQSAGLSGDPSAPWSPTNLITMTMVYWLPGPEVSLRWLANSTTIENMLWSTTTQVPLGITQYRDPTSPAAATSAQMQSQWAEMYHRVAMVRRREAQVRFAAWERPTEVVEDIRELAGLVTGISSASSQSQHHQPRQQQHPNMPVGLQALDMPPPSIVPGMTWQT